MPQDLQQEAYETLLGLMANNETRGADRLSFQAAGADAATWAPSPAVRELGDRLHAEGGVRAMLSVAAALKACHPGVPDREVEADMHELDHVWDGVGSWRC